MKRSLCIFLLAALLAAGCACGRTDGRGGGGAGEPADGRLKVATTIFPYYDFVRQIAGDDVELSLVVPAGMDSHSFEPTPADMRTLQQADVLICNGGGMEYWLKETLEALDTSHMEILVMMDYVDVLEEEHVEGMEDAAHAHELESAAHGHGPEPADLGRVDDSSEEADGHGGHGHWGDSGQDEHIWTSPLNAMKLVEAISAKLEEADPAHAGEYEANTQAYQKELMELHGRFQEVMGQRKRDMIILGDKFPFRYLADAYGLTYRAAFSGCSTDTEPGAGTIAYLIDQVRREGIPVVYYLELSSHRVSEIICEDTGAEMLLLHSCHNVTRSELNQGVTYLDLMGRNVENLRRGLVE